MTLKQILCAIVILCLLVGSAAASGFITKSVSFTDTIVNKEIKGNITMDVIVNDGGQTVSGIWSSLDGLGLSYPFEFKIGNRTEIISYPIEDQGALHEYKSVYINAPDFDLWNPSTWNGVDCPPKPAFCFPITTRRVLVVERFEPGSYGRFGNPDRSSTEDVSISMNGTTYRKTIGNGDKARGAISFYDNNSRWIANVMFVGASVTGAGTPNQDNYIATQTGNGWKIAPKVDYEAYVKSLTDTDNALKSWQDSQGLLKEAQKYNGKIVSDKWPCVDLYCSTVLNQINEHNANGEKLTSKNVKIDYASPTSEQTTIIGRGNVIDTLKRQIANDELIITMPASKVGIIVHTGKPQIEKIISPDFNDGDGDGYIRVFLKNVGDAQGTFAVRANGTNENKVTVSSGEIAETTLFFIAPLQGNVTGSVEAYDINSGETYSKQYNVNVTAPKTYIPNEETVYNNGIFLSDDSGMKNDLQEDCKGIYKLQDGKWKCFELENLEDPAPVQQQGPVQFTSTTPVEKEPPGLGFYEKLLIVFIGILILLVFVDRITTKQSRGFKKNVIGGSILNLILALALLLLLYALWPVIKNEINNFFVGLMKNAVGL